MTTPTKTLLISNAICLLGHKPIITLDNADAMTVAAEQAFDLLLPGILSQNNWRFATAIQPLTLSLEIPPAPWRAVYNLPAGFLKLIRLYPNIYEFDIYNNSKLYTVLNGLSFPEDATLDPIALRAYNRFSIEYIYQPPIDQLPPRFTNYFVYEVAKYLCLSSAQRPDYFAQIKAECQYQYAMAAASEAQNRPQFSQVLFPVLVNRNIGGFCGNSSGQG